MMNTCQSLCLCISQDEFVFCWSDWIKKVARPSSALVVVDVQNDFISGSLAIINCPAGQNGEDVSGLYFLNPFSWSAAVIFKVHGNRYGE